MLTNKRQTNRQKVSYNFAAMDNKTITVNPDSKLINTSENYEVEYWSQKFNVSAEVLKNAVAVAGTTAKDVEAYLNRAK